MPVLSSPNWNKWNKSCWFSCTLRRTTPAMSEAVHDLGVWRIALKGTALALSCASWCAAAHKQGSSWRRGQEATPGSNKAAEGPFPLCPLFPITDTRQTLHSEDKHIDTFSSYKTSYSYTFHAEVSVLVFDGSWSTSYKRFGGLQQPPGNELCPYSSKSEASANCYCEAPCPTGLPTAAAIRTNHSLKAARSSHSCPLLPGKHRQQDPAWVQAINLVQFLATTLCRGRRGKQLDYSGEIYGTVPACAAGAAACKTHSDAPGLLHIPRGTPHLAQVLHLTHLLPTCF